MRSKCEHEAKHANANRRVCARGVQWRGEVKSSSPVGTRPVGTGLPEALVGKEFLEDKLSPPSGSSLLCPDTTRFGPMRAEEEKQGSSKQAVRKQRTMVMRREKCADSSF